MRTKIILLFGLILSLSIVFSASDCSTSWNTSGSPLCSAHGYNTNACICKGDLAGLCWACDDSSLGFRICTKSNSACCKSGTSLACGTGCGGTKTCVNGTWGACTGIAQPVTYYRDADGDGKGSSTITTSACTQPSGYVTNNKDCDDSKASVYLGAPEICDGLDNDCDNEIDTGFACVKGSTNCSETCTYATRSTDCSGTKVANSEYNYGDSQGKYTQSFNGTTWAPVKSYHHSTIVQDCAWKCASGYTYNSGTNSCDSDIKQATCTGTLPSNTQWNDNGQEGKYSYLTGQTPNKTAHYSADANDCAYKCIDTHHNENDTCVINTKTEKCTINTTNGQLPTNSKWTDSTKNGYFTQTWINNAWNPTTKPATFTELIDECNYTCISYSKSCTPNPTKYCGSGIMECTQGGWGGCKPFLIAECTTNQYCSGGECSFCASGTKNCDGNLINGCEKNLQTDKNNCGECGTICEVGNQCVKGECVETNTTACANTVCKQGQECNTDTGLCVCSLGYKNCDSILENGCETNILTDIFQCGNCLNSCDFEEVCMAGMCVSGGTNACIDITCGENQECNPIIGTCDCELGFNNCDNSTENGCEVEGECQTPDVKKCSTDSECTTTQKCSTGGDCLEIVCGKNYTKNNHACECIGTVCNTQCYKEKGKCCSNNWNSGIEYCTFSMEDTVEIVNQTKDEEATQLLEQAIESYNKGEILKARAISETAELKAIAVTKNNPTEMVEAYDSALLAIQNKEYLKAIQIAQDAKEETDGGIGEETLIIIAIALIVIIIAGIIIAKFTILKKKEPKQQEEY